MSMNIIYDVPVVECHSEKMYGCLLGCTCVYKLLSGLYSSSVVPHVVIFIDYILYFYCIFYRVIS